jgi:hypothetical protein
MAPYSLGGCWGWTAGGLFLCRWKNGLARHFALRWKCELRGKTTTECPESASQFGGRRTSRKSSGDSCEQIVACSGNGGRAPPLGHGDGPVATHVCLHRDRSQGYLTGRSLGPGEDVVRFPRDAHRQDGQRRGPWQGTRDAERAAGERYWWNSTRCIAT